MLTPSFTSERDIFLSHLAHPELFHQLEKENPEYAKTLMEYSGDHRNFFPMMHQFLSWMLMPVGPERVREFIKIITTYPAQDPSALILYDSHWSDGNFVLDIDDPSKDSFAKGSILVKETCILLYEIDEFDGGFYHHHGIYVWEQIRNALLKCLDAPNPDTAWPEAIRSEYDPE